MDHLFLKGRRKGINVSLLGNIAFCYILVDIPGHTWTKSMEDTAMQTIKATDDFFTREAARHGKYLNIRNFVFKSFIPYEIQYADTKYLNLAANEILSNIRTSDGKFTSPQHMWANVKSKHNLDDAAICFVFPNEGRSFAHNSNTYYDAEYTMLIEYQDYKTFVHEICHLYGAVDYYYTDFVMEKVRRYFGSSVMMDHRDLFIDELTAYIIGWEDGLGSNAKAFLEETAHITAEQWTDSLKKSTRDGYGTINYTTRARYEGFLKAGLPHGKGIYSTPEGNRYEGEFENGHFSGQGKYTYSNGDVYIGQFANDTFNGKGCYYHHQGGTTKGTWKDGKCIKKSLF